MKIEYHGKTDRGLVRENNEDSFFAGKVKEGVYAFIVADGMGGHNAGEVASKSAINYFIQALKKEDNYTEKFFYETIRMLNSRIKKIGKEDLKKEGLGTTFSALIFVGETVFIVHVGDTRIYRFNRSSQLLTEDHSIVEKLFRGGLISKEEAEHHPRKNVLYQSLGMKGEINPEVEKFKVNEGTTFLLCSDGLHGIVEEETILDIVKKYPLDKAVKKLIDIAKDRGGPDNITVVAVKITETSEEGDIAEIKVKFSGKKVRRLVFFFLLFLLFILFLTVFLLFVKPEIKRLKNERGVNSTRGAVEEKKAVSKEGRMIYLVKRLFQVPTDKVYFTNKGVIYRNGNGGFKYVGLLKGGELNISNVSHSSKPLMSNSEDNFLFFNEKDRKLYLWSNGEFKPYDINFRAEKGEKIIALIGGDVFSLKGNEFRIFGGGKVVLFSKKGVKKVFLRGDGKFSVAFTDGNVEFYDDNYIKEDICIKMLSLKTIPEYIFRYSNHRVFLIEKKRIVEVCSKSEKLFNGFIVKDAISFDGKSVYMFSYDNIFFSLIFKGDIL